MITDEKTGHNHDRVDCCERNLEPLAGKPVLLRRILPLLRRRHPRTSLSLHRLDSGPRRRLKPRIPSPEEKTHGRRDWKTRESKVVQVEQACAGPWKSFVVLPGQDHAHRTSPGPGFSSHCICRSSSAKELNAFEWRGTWYSSILDVSWFEDCYTLSFHVSETRPGDSAFDFDLELHAQGPI